MRGQQLPERFFSFMELSEDQKVDLVPWGQSKNQWTSNRLPGVDCWHDAVDHGFEVVEPRLGGEIDDRRYGYNVEPTAGRVIPGFVE